MLESILAFLRARPQAAPASPPFGAERVRVAVLVLLLEVSQIDRELGESERATVLRLARERFALDAGAAAPLVELADTALAAALDDWIFTRTVRDAFDGAERIEVLRMLWQVALADGRLRPFEEALIERIAARLAVPPADADRVRDEARELARSAGRPGAR